MGTTIKITDFIKTPLLDKKINANSWMSIMTVRDYLEMISLADNPYQRQLQQLSFYKKLINDLLNDGVMPAISVVYNSKIDSNNFILSTDKKFKIIDGLQRTNCLRECLQKLEKETDEFLIKNKDDFLNKKIYVEIWEDIDLRSILYKMVVLNTGQKKMDYSHQLDILSESIEGILKENHIPYLKSIEKVTAKDKKGKFLLSNITTGLISYINRSPISGKKNAAEFLFNKLDTESDNEKEMELIDNKITYKNIIWVLSIFSKKLDDIYEKGKNPLLQYDIFLVSFLAALGKAQYKAKDNIKIQENLQEKIQLLENISKDNDILGIEKYLEWVDKLKSGIGDKRRKFIFETVFEFLVTSEVRSSTFEWAEKFNELFEK